MQSEYIVSLLSPRPLKSQSTRRVWGLSLQDTVIPFLTASNVAGHTSIERDALGAPIRLAFDKAGEVRFSKAGQPVTRVAKPVTNAINLMRDNLVANMHAFTASVINDNADDYRAEVDACVKASEPVIKHEGEKLSIAYQRLSEAQDAAELDALIEREAVAV